MLTGRLFNNPAWGAGSRFNDWYRMRRDMDRLFDVLSKGSAGSAPAGVFPLINLTEDKDAYYARAELPGLDSENLDIQVTGNTLSVSGERKISAQDDNVKYHRRERESGKFSRVLKLPGEIDSGKVEAELKNGILKITIPKAEAAKPKQIVVK